MGIRFTETEKWADKLFRKWKPETKLLFLFIVDNCDCAGFWEIDLELAAFHIGIEVGTLNESFKELEDRFLSDSKSVWVKSFLKHQKHESLKPQDKAVIGILRRIARQKSLRDQVLTELDWESELPKEIDEYR